MITTQEGKKIGLVGLGIHITLMALWLLNLVLTGTPFNLGSWLALVAMVTLIVVVVVGRVAINYNPQDKSQG